VKAETLDDITRDTVRLACKYSTLIDPENEVHTDDMGVVDFITVEDGGWVCRVFPATSEASPISVPGVAGVQPTMTGAMVALNQWLSGAVAQVTRRGSA
jgi:uncharacterized GH25 family protein